MNYFIRLIFILFYWFFDKNYIEKDELWLFEIFKCRYLKSVRCFFNKIIIMKIINRRNLGVFFMYLRVIGIFYYIFVYILFREVFYSFIRKIIIIEFRRGNIIK